MIDSEELVARARDAVILKAHASPYSFDDTIIRHAIASALEDAAKWCDAHTMGHSSNDGKNVWSGYFAAPAMAYGKHQGNAYAAFLRKLIPKGL